MENLILKDVMLNPVVLLKDFWRAWKTAELQQKFSLMQVILYLGSWRTGNTHTPLVFVICIIRNTSFDVFFKDATFTTVSPMHKVTHLSEIPCLNILYIYEESCSQCSEFLLRVWKKEEKCS